MQIKKTKISEDRRSPRLPSGINYGTGVRNKMGRAIDVMGHSISKNKKTKPPRSLA